MQYLRGFVGNNGIAYSLEREAASCCAIEACARTGIAWDIIAPKPGAGENSFREREFLSAYEGIREGLAMAA